MKTRIPSSLLLLLIITMLSGCAHKYAQSDYKTIVEPLDASKRVLISVPPDGQYKDIHYDNSGRMVANAVRGAFAKHATGTHITTDCQGKDCLDTMDRETYGYYVEPEILHWEDRATEWSGKPDRIRIQLTVYDSANQAELASSMLEGKSKWATFGGDHPEDLLAEPVTAFVSSLYK